MGYVLDNNVVSHAIDKHVIYDTSIALFGMLALVIITEISRSLCAV